MIGTRRALLTTRVDVPTLGFNFASNRSLSSSQGGVTLTYTRASAQTFFDSTSTMQNAANDVACFDYNPVTGASLGLSLWEARTNLFLNSLLDGTALSTQGVTTTAIPYTVTFYGTGTITFSGAYAGSPLVGSGALVRSSVTFTPSAGTVTCTVTGTVKWANFEAGDFATPFIVTAGATATRAASSCTTTNISWYNTATGTFVSAAMSMGTASVNNAVMIDDGSANNRIRHTYNGASQRGVFLVTDGTVAQATITPVTTVAQGTMCKMASSWVANLFDNATNGVLGTQDTSGTIPTGLTTLGIGMSGSATNPLNGWFSSASYYPQRFSQTQLLSMTV